MCPAAARFSDPISHTSTAASALKMLGSLVVGAVIGAAVTALVVAAAVATVATGGLALPSSTVRAEISQNSNLWRYINQ